MNELFHSIYIYSICVLNTHHPCPNQCYVSTQINCLIGGGFDSKHLEPNQNQVEILELNQRRFENQVKNRQLILICDGMDNQTQAQFLIESNNQNYNNWLKNFDSKITWLNPKHVVTPSSLCFSLSSHFHYLPLLFFS